MCRSDTLFEVLADLSKRKQQAYSAGEAGLPKVQEIEDIEQHLKRLLVPRAPIENLIPADGAETDNDPLSGILQRRE